MEEIEIHNEGDDPEDAPDQLAPSDWSWVREMFWNAIGEIASDMEKELPEWASIHDVAADVLGNFLGACAYTIRSVEESEGVLLGSFLRKVQDEVMSGNLLGGLGFEDLPVRHGIESSADEELKRMGERICAAAIKDVEFSIALDRVGVIPKWIKGAAVIKRLCEPYGVTGPQLAAVAACGPVVIGSVYRNKRTIRILLSVMWEFYEFLRRSGVVLGMGRVGEA